jgi:hypothetical protein
MSFSTSLHGLGPGYIQQPASAWKFGIPLKNLTHHRGNAKPTSGIWNLLYAQQHKLVTSFDERQRWRPTPG